MIETKNEDLNASLQQLQDLSIDINVFSSQTLVHMQIFTNQELEDREKSIIGKFFQSREMEEKV